MINLEHRDIHDLGTLQDAPEEELAHLSSHVKVLRLSHNQLVGLGSALSLLGALTDVDVSHNHLESLAGEFPAGLRRFVATHNRLASLEGGLQRCTELEHLDLSCNRITSLRGLPETLHCQPGALTLVLRQNLVARTHRITTNSALVERLGTLDLSSNKIDSLADVAALAACTQLRTVMLSGNPVIDTKPQCTSILLAQHPGPLRVTPTPSETIRRAAEAAKGVAHASSTLQESGTSVSIGTSLNATVMSLREAMHQLQVERGSNAQLREDLRREKLRSTDLANALKQRGLLVAQLRQELSDVVERCSQLERKLLSNAIAREPPPPQAQPPAVRTAATPTPRTRQRPLTSPPREDERGNSGGGVSSAALVDALMVENADLAARVKELLAERIAWLQQGTSTTAPLSPSTNY